MTHSDSRLKQDISDSPDLAVQNMDPRQAEQALRERERLLDSLIGLLPGSAYRALADEHWTALLLAAGRGGRPRPVRNHHPPAAP
jgi:hypothetical protein